MDTQWADGNDHYFQSKRKGQETISLVKSSVLPYESQNLLLDKVVINEFQVFTLQ